MISDAERQAIEAVLASELGTGAKFRQHIRDIRTPMNFVLDQVEQKIGQVFVVYWVERGTPTMFSLDGFSQQPVVFSTRYIELVSFVRELLVGNFSFSAEDQAELAERSALRLIAELALRYGDPDLAVLTFLKSVLGKDYSIVRLRDFLGEGEVLMELELQPKCEGYMAVWFYGLLHELGHLEPRDRGADARGPFRDDWIFGAIESVLQDLLGSEALKQEALAKAKRNRADFVLGVDHLREEGFADMFACSILLHATYDIMTELKGQRFRLEQFVSEMTRFQNILAFIERCRSAALLGSVTKPPDPEVGLELSVYPASVAVRAMMVRAYLDLAGAAYLFDTESPTDEQLDRVRRVFDEIADLSASSITAANTGLGAALQFVLFPAYRQPDWDLLEAFRKQIDSSDQGSMAREEAKSFCILADSVGADGKLIVALKRVISSPSEPVVPDLRGDRVYFLPWVKGPNGMSRPFGLDTKYGHLVLAFLGQGQVFQWFIEASAGTLKDGHTLERNFVAVPRPQQLASRIADHMPKGKPFGIVVEGTAKFSQVVRELSEGSIWPDD